MRIPPTILMPKEILLDNRPLVKVSDQESEINIRDITMLFVEITQSQNVVFIFLL